MLKLSFPKLIVKKNFSSQNKKYHDKRWGKVKQKIALTVPTFSQNGGIYIGQAGFFLFLQWNFCFLFTHRREKKHHFVVRRGYFPIFLTKLVFCRFK